MYAYMRADMCMDLRVDVDIALCVDTCRVQRCSASSTGTGMCKDMWHALWQHLLWYNYFYNSMCPPSIHLGAGPQLNGASTISNRYLIFIRKR